MKIASWLGRLAGLLEYLDRLLWRRSPRELCLTTSPLRTSRSPFTKSPYIWNFHWERYFCLQSKIFVRKWDIFGWNICSGKCWHWRRQYHKHSGRLPNKSVLFIIAHGIITISQSWKIESLQNKRFIVGTNQPFINFSGHKS